MPVGIGYYDVNARTHAVVDPEISRTLFSVHMRERAAQVMPFCTDSTNITVTKGRLNGSLQES